MPWEQRDVRWEQGEPTSRDARQDEPRERGAAGPPLSPFHADPLAMLYEPQVEQFGISLEPCGPALVGRTSTRDVDAAVVVYRVDGCCVVTSHRVRVKRDLPFEELGTEGLSVCSLSADSLRECPIPPEESARAAGNVAVFGQVAYTRRYWLRAGQEHNATSVTFLPAWLDRLDDGQRALAQDLTGAAGGTCPVEVAPTIDRVLAAVTPLFGGTVARGRQLHAGVDGALALALAWYGEERAAEQAAGTYEQAELVRAARRYIVLHLDEQLTLEQLVSALYTSRSRLCTAFRQETGESLGAYIRRSRIERACELLGVARLSVADVAHAVGYPRVSSFTVAFKRAVGCSPTTWRQRV